MSAAEWSEGGTTETLVRAPHSRVRSVLGGVAIVVVTILLWMLSGFLGLLGGGLLFLAWAALPATYTFAVGQVIFIGVTRQDSLLELGLLPVMLVELGLGGILVGPMLRSIAGRRSAVWTLLGGSILAVLALSSYVLWERVWVAATILIGITALVAYGFHRYELVVLGKVPDLDGEAFNTEELEDDERFSTDETDVDTNRTRSQGASEPDRAGDFEGDEYESFGGRYNGKPYAADDSTVNERGFGSTNRGGAASDEEDDMP